LFTLFVVPCIYVLIAAQHKHAELDADGLPIERAPANRMNPSSNGHGPVVAMS
jgi:hypothetical protein